MIRDIEPTEDITTPLSSEDTCKPDPNTYCGLSCHFEKFTETTAVNLTVWWQILMQSSRKCVVMTKLWMWPILGLRQPCLLGSNFFRKCNKRISSDAPYERTTNGPKKHWSKNWIKKQFWKNGLKMREYLRNSNHQEPLISGEPTSLARQAKLTLYRTLDAEKKQYRHPSEEVLRILFGEIKSLLNSLELKDLRSITTKEFFNSTDYSSGYSGVSSISSQPKSIFIFNINLTVWITRVLSQTPFAHNVGLCKTKLFLLCWT